ncbi:integrin alpha-E-like [Cyprinus carpio]|uniref:Integrin alpha-E-like n=1 Tax=Cyprinus carpio TaxID=7962 RepID=A0A9Q9Y0M1_CYPCA|nr:integrin alpha-E-like [Cyprinus carpio]
MYRGLLFTIVIYSVTGFNIKKSPVKNFTNGDPLFGQTIIQSTDGVFVPSPKLGKLFRCTLENECVEVNSDDKKPKGLRPVASVSSLTSGEEQHVMMCNQIRVKQSATEDLNGDCKLVDSTGKFIKKFNPVALVNNNNNNNNNNNHYQARWIGQDQRRMRRDAQSHSDTKDKDKDYDDAGTEIAFVLDGSGSIDHDDFQRAKDFIYNVMSNVWKTCFNCDFAIVQYGLEIRTELSLLDSKNHARALLKVKEIQQLGMLTMTASAIHHVLTDIFIPENGSKKNSKKIIIVLSDGKILGDPMKLTDVLNMPQMKGVTRYSIGVGEGILNDTQAIKEMTQIADPDKFYKVSNYAALNDILSSLQQNLTGIEDSQQGGGFQFQLAEAGFSSHLMQDNSFLFGAVGAYGWSGGVILQSDKTVKFLNDSNNGPKFSYLGYSVTSAKVRPSKTLYISGAPRYNLTGGVFIFSGSEKYVLQGDQVGSYFGSVLCSLDIDRNQYTDYLLVGAPHFHQSGEEGKVLVYRLNQEDRFESVATELQGDTKQTFARFGAAIASIGDIDGQKQGCSDCFSPIKIKLNFALAQQKEDPVRILDAFTLTEVVQEISFEKECKTTDCKPSITLSDSKISETLIIIGETQSLNININLTNTGDPSYMTTLTLTFPSILSQRKIEGATCPVKNDNQIQCNLQHPIFKSGTQTNLFISWQLSDTKSELKNYGITANLTSQNLGFEILDTKIYEFSVMHSLPIQLTGTAIPNRLRIEEGQKVENQKMQFIFQFEGENKYGATIKVVVNIIKDTFKTDLEIINVKPQEECVFPKNTKVEGNCIITCNMTKLQKIIIDANVLIHDVQEKSDKITAVGTYSFDESIYAAKHTSRTIPVEVIITKLQVTTSIGPIIGGSIGGFLLLFIIIIVLIKCGFFRRRHKVDQAQSPN